MDKLLYVIAGLLIVGWAIGFLGYSSRGIIHILLVVAVILAIYKALRGKKIQ
jgi:hypothetical protein